MLTALAAGVTDPFNIAASFVPVVGEARAGLWAARYGKFAARAAEGAIEGGVGQAILEPINIATERAYGNQYGPMDSFMNVAFGTILGGGLHTGFGALSDLMGRMSPETREQTLRTAVAQMAEGRDVNVAPVVSSDPGFGSVERTIDLSEPSKIGADRPVPVITAESRYADLGPTGARGQAFVDAMDNIRGTYRNADTGWDIEVAQRGLKKSLSGEGSAVRAEIVNNLPEILERSVLGETRAPREGVGSLTAVHRLYAPVELDGRLNSVELTVKEHGDGVRRHYSVDHVEIGNPDASSLASQARLGTAEQQSGLPAVNLGRLREPFNNKTGTTEIPLNPKGFQTPDQAASAARQEIDKARTDTLTASKGEGPQISGRPFTETEQAVREAKGDDLAAELQEANQRLAAYEKQGVLTPEEIEAAKASEVTEDANLRSKAADAAAICLNLHP